MKAVQIVGLVFVGICIVVILIEFIKMIKGFKKKK
jgi:hypothetical protein